MRIPFDLIAAIILAGGIGKYLESNIEVDPSWIDPVTVIAMWTGFLGLVWLMNEFITRRVEWLTRFGHHFEGLPGAKRSHPIEWHTRAVRVVQALTVGLFALLLWALQWPL